MKRMKNESYDDYIKARKRQDMLIKRHLQGRVVWDSSKHGTYRKAVKVCAK